MLPTISGYATAATWKCERGRLDLSENGSMPGRYNAIPSMTVKSWRTDSGSSSRDKDNWSV
jgi:hypothetical protein